MTLWCVTGVVHVGRDPVAAAVRYRLPVILLLHLADTLQDAAGHLANAGEGGSGGGASVFGVHCGARVPWEHRVDVLHPEKPQAFPVLPTAQSVTGLGALALSCLA